MYPEADRLRVVETACNKRPPDTTQWSVRSLAQATGVGRDTVHKILREHKLKPHRIGTFSHSPDPDFVACLLQAGQGGGRGRAVPRPSRERGGPVRG